MKPLTLAFFIFLLHPLSAQETLSPADREALLEQIEKIGKAAGEKANARFRIAMTAFKRAANSPNAAFDLYMNCEEKVNFDEMNKKNVDFREWKRTNEEKLSDVGFRLALQQQLRWLIITIEAAAEEPDLEELAIEAGKIIDNLVTKAEVLSEHRSIIEQGVTSSVFARAYDINGLKLDSWPLSPAPLNAVYEQAILPPLRSARKIEAIKAAWSRRMANEGILLNEWSGKPGEKKKPGVRSPEYEKFVSETVPKLRWDTEVDLYKAGDQKAAAIRMLAHINDNLTHEAAKQWTEDFIALIDPPEIEEGEVLPDDQPK
jgi:hypothetical protein